MLIMLNKYQLKLIENILINGKLAKQKENSIKKFKSNKLLNQFQILTCSYFKVTDNNAKMLDYQSQNKDISNIKLQLNLTMLKNISIN